MNEEKHIERVIHNFLNSGYEALKEILIADGGSTDATRELVQKISAQDDRVILVDNPEKYQSYALNRMIEQARGEVFLRADGHCEYQEDYIQKNIEVFLKTEARNVGGAQRYMAANKVQAGTAIAVKSFLGNGGAKYMSEGFEGFADTVFLGCFWTKDLRKIGGFNTNNVTNQDSELNLRLIEEFGNSIYVSPEIKSWYYPRASYQSLFKQYFRYGRGRFLTKLQHPGSAQKRGLTPFFFLLFMVFYGIAELITPADLYFMEFFAVMAAIVIGEALRTVFSQKKNFENEVWKGESKSPGLFTLWGGSVISIVIMLSGHFSGFAYQLLRNKLARVKGW